MGAFGVIALVAALLRSGARCGLPCRVLGTADRPRAAVLAVLNRTYPRVIRVGSGSPGRGRAARRRLLLGSPGRWSQPWTASCCPRCTRASSPSRSRCRSARRSRRPKQSSPRSSEAILTEKQHIESLILTVGYDSANSQRSDEGEHTARFKILLDESEPRRRRRGGGRSRGCASGSRAFRISRRASCGRCCSARRRRSRSRSTATTCVELKQSRRTWPQAEHGRDCPELADVETTLRSGAPEVQIIYDRDRLSRYDLNIRQVARLVRDKVKGFEATRFNLQGPPHPDPRPADPGRPRDGRGRPRHHHQSRRRPADPSVLRGRGDAGRGTQRGAPHRRPARGGDQRQHRRGLAERRDPAHRRDAATARSTGPPTMTFFISGQNEEWERSQQQPVDRPGSERLPGLRDHGRAVRVADPPAGDHADHPAGLRRHRASR